MTQIMECNDLVCCVNDAWGGVHGRSGKIDPDA